MENNFGQVITAMITPFKPSTHEVDYEEAKKLAIHLIKLGSDALVLSGTTGEAPATHIEEKAMLISEVKEALAKEFPNQKIPILAGTGSNDTVHAVTNSHIASKANADGLLVVTPYYSRPTQEGIYQHYLEIAKEVDLPIVIYDVPSRCGVKIEHSTYLKLAENQKFVSIKDATGNPYQAYKNVSKMNKIRQELKFKNITLYCGDDSLLLPYLSFGAKGIISVASHLVADKFKDIILHYQNQNPDQALALFEDCINVIDCLNGRGAQAVDTKAALELMGIIKSKHMRLPNIMADDQALERIKKCLNIMH